MATTTKRPRRAKPLVADRDIGLTSDRGIVADPSIEDALHELDGRYLQCRDLRHSWELQGFWSDGGQLKRRLHCARCTTDRIDTWSFDGRQRVGGHYDYPDGYLLTGHDGHAKPLDVRHEIVERATVYGDEQEMIAALVRRGRGRKQ